MLQDTTDEFQMWDLTPRHSVTTWCIGATLGLLVLQGFLGVILVTHRIGWLTVVTDEAYYTLLTGHGLLALAVTWFAIGALFTWALSESPDRDPILQRIWFGLLCIGTILSLLMVVLGLLTDVDVAVTYTLQPPLRPHIGLLAGLGLLVGALWLASVTWLRACWRWRRETEDSALPLPVFIVAVTSVLLSLSVIGVLVAVVLYLGPFSLGIVDTVPALRTTSLFWTFGQALGYIWLLATYLVLYTVLPRVVETKLFSDPLARLVCLIILVAGPVLGFHHQYLAPGIPAAWKLATVIRMMALVLASLLTVFTVLATLEYSARPPGDRTLVRWVGRFDWHDPPFAAIALGGVSMLLGAPSGIVQANPQVNQMVSNSLWIVGHFHLMLVGGVVSVFVGAMYWLLPRTSGHVVRPRRLAIVQVYTWFTGVVVLSLAMQLSGLGGMRRRIPGSNAPGEGGWILGQDLLDIGMGIGGLLLFLSTALLAVVLLATYLRPAERTVPTPALEALSGPQSAPVLVHHIPLWTVLSIVFLAITYWAIFVSFVG